MDSVIYPAAIYLFLVVIMRVAGKRTLGDLTAFDLVLLLIISEATQQAMIGNDFSLTRAIVVITTLVLIDIGFSHLTQRSRLVSKVMEGVPLVVVEDGRLLRDRADRERIDESDILEAARRLQGLERMDQIKYAVLERSGGISIIPKSG